MEEEIALSEVETTIVSPLGAAALQALGCPHSAPHGENVLVPAEFGSWGVAVVGGVALGSGNVVHDWACDIGGEVRQVTIPDIAALSSGMCRCDRPVRLILAGSGLSAPALERLLYDVENVVLAEPPEDYAVTDVAVQLRSTRVGAGIDSVLGRFADGNVLPPALADAVCACRTWVRGHAHEAAAALQRDGLARLLEFFEGRRAPRPGARRVADTQAGARALAAVLAAAPALPCESVVCMFTVSDVFIDAALAATPHAAVGGWGPGMQRRAVAVLPLRLAAHVCADFAVEHPDMAPAAAFIGPVDAVTPSLSQVCAVALDAWDRAGLEPEAAWKAALSACT